MREQQRRALLTQLVRTSLNASQIELAARAEGSHVIISVDAGDVRLEQQNNRRIGLLSLALRLESQQGSTEKISNIRVSITEDQYLTALKSGLVIDDTVPQCSVGRSLADCRSRSGDGFSWIARADVLRVGTTSISSTQRDRLTMSL
jgi:hypothetical protein